VEPDTGTGLAIVRRVVLEVHPKFPDVLPKDREALASGFPVGGVREPVDLIEDHQHALASTAFDLMAFPLDRRLDVSTAEDRGCNRAR
jgi:hypothetical protein